MRRIKQLLSCLIITLALCSVTAQATIRVKDELRMVELPQTPTRIVVLEYSFADALAAVGVSPVGVADDLNPERIIPQVHNLIADWTSVGMRSQPSLEVISRLKPDLIIADLHRHRVSYPDLSRIAPTLLLKSRGESYQESLASALIIGRAIDKEQAMRARLSKHKALMEVYRSRFSDYGTVQFANVNDRGMWLHGPLSYTGSLLQYLGLQPAMPELTSSYLLEANLEVLLRVNPDWLFYSNKKTVTVLDSWRKSPLFSLLKISRSQQSIQVSPDLWSRNRGMLAAEGVAEELDAILNGGAHKP